MEAKMVDLNKLLKEVMDDAISIGFPVSKNLEKKIYSIEQIDEKVVGPIVKTLTEKGEPFKILICPDHPTPIATMTHCSDPIPYLIYDSRKKEVGNINSYDEFSAKESGVYEPVGYKLMYKFLEK